MTLSSDRVTDAIPPRRFIILIVQAWVVVVVEVVVVGEVVVEAGEGAPAGDSIGGGW
jgi:preprotein translocase subunit SecG